MRISPKSLLQGLLYLAPVTLLALASCGGGGGGTTATLAAYYPLSVSVTGISGVVGGSGVVLRNGGDNMTPTADGTYQFANPVLSGSTYNISVLTQPTTTPTQVCTVTGPVGTMPAYAKTVPVTCVNAYTIGVKITGNHGTGLVLQNNGADNYQAASSVTGFTFSTPVAKGGSYDVTILKQPLNPATACGVSSNSGTNVQSNITGASAVQVTCSSSTRPADPYVYATNSDTANNAYAFTSNSGSLATNGKLTGSGYAAIAADGGKFVLIASGGSSGFVTSYAIASAVSATPGKLTKVNAVAAGNTPVAIAVHPSGKFAYVVNEVSNSISAYSIANDGTLAPIYASPTAPTITAGDIPVAIAIDPAGTYAYVANARTGSGACGTSSGCITVFAIDPNTGALTPTIASGSSNIIAAGQVPSSIAIDSTGQYIYVTNLNDTKISTYIIGSNGTLTAGSPYAVAVGCNSVAISPDGQFVYVANSTAGTVSEYTVGANGALSSLPLVTVATGGNPSYVVIDSSGQYAYVADSGNGRISAYSISAGQIATALSSYISAGANPVAVITAP